MLKSLSQILRSFGNGKQHVTNTLVVQELKDAVYSMKPPFGSFSMNVPAGATVATAGQYVTAGGLTQDNNRNYLMTVSNQRLTYTGTSPRHFHIAVSVSFTGEVNATVGLKLAKNSEVIDDTEVTRYVSRIDVGSTAVHGDVMLSEGDYIELWVTSDTDGDVVTIENLYLFAVGMLV